MKALLLALSVMCSCISYGQAITAPPSKKVLILDETWVVASGEKSFRLITSNDSIAHWIRSRFEVNGNEMSSASESRKKDRMGEYWERSFYFKNEHWDTVASFIKWIEKNKDLRKRK